MKNLKHIIGSLATVIFMSAVMSSCITITDQGPRGQNGNVYYGIDYDYNPPYSYWDNNNSIPNNPFFGEFYRSNRGTYDFEYFINPWEYWYGTYTLHRNLGEPGGAYNTPGRDGDDTYLLLICNDNGFYFEGWDECLCYRTQNEDGSINITGSDELHGKFELTMKKASVTERAPVGTPKFKKSE
ncbi:MAG: hypothetical protein AB8B53_05100 [Flavobacteriales bacterium]